jgi:hypothetical protein
MESYSAPVATKVIRVEHCSASAVRNFDLDSDGVIDLLDRLFVIALANAVTEIIASKLHYPE